MSEFAILLCFAYCISTWDFVLVEFPCPEGKYNDKKPEKQHFINQQT